MSLRLRLEAGLPKDCPCSIDDRPYPPALIVNQECVHHGLISLSKGHNCNTSCVGKIELRGMK